MSRNFGYSKSDLQATSIANAIVKALTRLEYFNDDPEIVLDCLRVAASTAPRGVKDAVTAIRHHYLDPSDWGRE